MNDNEIINDWKPETRSLLERLMAAGFDILSGDNGEDSFCFPGHTSNSPHVPTCKDIRDFINNAIATDEVHIRIRFAATPKARPSTLWLVLGNSPGELVCDYGIPGDKAVAAVLDAATRAHADAWELKGQPKCTWATREYDLSKPEVPTTRELLVSAFLNLCAVRDGRGQVSQNLVEAIGEELKKDVVVAGGAK